MNYPLGTNINLLFLLIMLSGLSSAQSDRYSCTNGIIKFKSVAPLETIEAESKDLNGVIDASNKAFAFTVLISTFQGFNSPLQREHFNENYMESNQFKAATFEGKIIEDIDFEKDGTYTARAKGILIIHGVGQERIIKTTINIKNGKIKASSKFIVLLADHNISIPKIVNQKLSSEINVSIDTYFTKKNNRPEVN